MRREIGWTAAAVLALLGTAMTGAVAAPAPKPIKACINVSMTGVLADNIKPTMLADQLWEKQINARGGLLGRPVAMSFLDNKSNPETAVAIYERFLEGDCDFIFEDSGSLVVQRESTLAEQQHKLFLVPNGFAKSLYERGYKYLFYTGTAVSEDLNIGLVKLLQSLPPAERPKTIGYVTVQNIAFTSVTRGVQDMLKPLGFSTVDSITYPPNLNDATSLVDDLKEKKPDIVFQTGLSNDTVLFARAVAQQGLKYKLFAVGMTSAALPNFVGLLGNISNGLVYASAWEPQLPTPGNADFVKSYAAANGVPPIYNAAQGYARWQIFEQAVDATKSLDQTVLRDYIAKHAFATVVGRIQYNDKGYMTPDDTVVTQFQNGKRLIVWPKKEATGSFVYPAGPS